MNLQTLNQSLEELKIEIGNKQVILFTDFDGTLLPIQNHPTNVVLSVETKTLLSVLSRMIPVTVISGRSLKELKEKVVLREINLSGNHGLEIDGPVGFYLNPEAILSFHTISKISSLLNDSFRSESRIFVENKILSLSIHYHMIPADQHDEIEQSISSILRPYIESKEIQVTRGKNVMEVRPPVDWGKEEAIRWILDKYQNVEPQKTFFPIYAGDDVTDMNALSYINLKGCAIWVGDPKANVTASSFVSNSLELIDFLYWLNAFLKERYGK